MNRNQSITWQFVRAAMIALTVSVATAAPAQAIQATVQRNYVKLGHSSVDFGSGTHLFGGPSGNAVVTWLLDMPVAGQTNGNVIVTARIQGTFYWDSVDPGCGSLVITFLSSTAIFDGPPGTVSPEDTDVQKRDLCGTGGDANDPANQLAIDVRSSSARLGGVRIEVQAPARGGVFFVDDAREFFLNFNQYDVTINGGTADFGNGLHVFGAPTGRGGGVVFSEGGLCRPTDSTCIGLNTDTGTYIHLIVADVDGILYWDSLFTSGCARLEIQFQDIFGTPLSTRNRDKCGPGGNANDSDNKRVIAEGTFLQDTFAPALFKVRLRVGEVSHGSFVNTPTSRTFPLFGEAGHFTLAPVAAVAHLHEPLDYEFTWTVPEPLTWHDLQALQVRIRGDAGTVLWLRWDEASNTFAVFNEASGKFGHAFPAGSPARLETRHATLDLAQTSVAAVESVLGAGAASPSVLLKLALTFKPSAVGGPYLVEVAGSDDFGHEDPFALAGTLSVTPRQ